MTLIVQAAEEIVSAAIFQPEPPRPLRRELPPARPFPIDALGPLLGAAARGIQDRLQVPDAIAGQSVLAAAALAVQAHADVAMPYGQSRPVGLYCLTVAASGDRKTASDAEALWPVRTYEAELREAHSPQQAGHANAHEVWESERRRILADRTLEPTARRAALDDLGAAPEPPRDPLVTCPEPTFEGLTVQFAQGRPALGIFSDEGGQFVGGHGMSTDHRLKTSAGLSSLWDGQPIRRVRKGDGTMVLPGRRLTLHLMMQPDVAAQLMSDPLLKDQGLLSRMLPVVPATLAGTRLWREPDPASDAAIKRYGARLLDILRTPLPSGERPGSGLQPRALPLSPSARALWIRFADQIEGQMGPGGPLENVRGFAAKAAEHAARVAAVLALVDNLHAQSVGESDLARGIKLAQHYLGEWLRVHDAAETRPELVRAERLLAWLLDGWHLDVVGLPEVYQLGPNRLRDAKTAREALNLLEEHGWVRRLDEGAKVGDTFRRDAWRIVGKEQR